MKRSFGWYIIHEQWLGREAINASRAFRTRREAIAEWCDNWQTGNATAWRYWYNRGFRCVKVELVWVAPNA